MSHFFFTLEKACFGQVLDYELAGFFAGKSAIFFWNVFIQCSVRIKEIDYLKIVSLSDFPVVGVMCRCDFYHTCSEFFVYIRICDNRDFFTCERQFEHFADQSLVTLVIRVYCDCRITKEGFRSGCSDFDFAASVSIFVEEMVHSTLCVNMVNFIIGKGGSTAGTPVYKTLTFVHKAPLIQSDEYITDSL